MTVNPEAVTRTVIGRAYYTAHWEARDFAEKVDRQKFSKKKSIHAAVIHHFRDSKKKSKIKLSKDLDLLRKMRVQADYHLTSVQCQPADGEMAVGLAQRILGYIPALPAEVTQSKAAVRSGP